MSGTFIGTVTFDSSTGAGRARLVAEMFGDILNDVNFEKIVMSSWLSEQVALVRTQNYAVNKTK